MQTKKVEVVPYDETWASAFEKIKNELEHTVGDLIVGIEHIGSTSVEGLSAKPIIDIAVGVKTLDSIKPYIELLGKNGIIFRKEDVKEQLLFVMGDFEKEFRTHHIHVVEWNSVAWKNYIN